MDDQIPCSPLSSCDDDHIQQPPMHVAGQDCTSPVVGRKRRKHSGPLVRPTCNECGKDFSNQSALSKHKLTHSDVRRFSCEICQKAFKRQDHLNGHMLTHREKKPYECDVEGCEKTYCDARSLRRHKENHHSSINVLSSHATNPVTTHSTSSALRSLLSGHPGVLFPHHNLITSHTNSFNQHVPMGNSAPSIPANSASGSHTGAHLSHSPLTHEMAVNQGFAQGHGFTYPAIGNDEMPSPHPPPPPRMRQQPTPRETPVHAQHPLPVVLNHAPSYNSYSVPTTPTAHPQTPVSTGPLPSPHHLSVNNGNHYGPNNGHDQHSHPCTPTQVVNTFSFSPHQVQQYHQQQQSEQNQNGVRSLPATPTGHQNHSPSTPVAGFLNGCHQYQQVYQHGADPHHGPRSLPDTPAEHQGIPGYPMHHPATSYNDPNPSPYSVASQSSPYDLHQPASHLQSQQSNNSNFQAHHEPRQQLHSTGTYEDEPMNDTFQPANHADETDLDDYDITQIDVQNLMEQIQSQSSSGQSLQLQQQQQQHFPSIEHQSFYPQTEPITPTTPATPTQFNCFPIPNKFQAHNFRTNVIHPNQDTHVCHGFQSVGKSMTQIICTQQPQQVAHNQHQQMLLSSEPVSQHQDVTNSSTHQDPDPGNFQIPSLLARNRPPSNPTAIDLLKQGRADFSSSSVPTIQNVTMSQNFGASIGYRQELRSTTPPNLVVNLSPMTSLPVASGTVTNFVESDVQFRQPLAKNCTKNSTAIDDEDEVFPPCGPESSTCSNESCKPYPQNCKPSEYHPNLNGLLAADQPCGNGEKSVKKSHETGGVIVHGTDQNVRQPNSLQIESNNLLMQALQQRTAQHLEKKGSNENKRPPENNKDELRSPKRMRHKPEPIYIPPQVNAFGVSNLFSSRPSRSPRIWDGKGSQMSSSVNQNIFAKLTSNQGSFDSKISPPPYTPPPMLSPVRTSFGYYYHINISSTGTPRIPIPPSFSNFGAVGVNRKVPSISMAKDGGSSVPRLESITGSVSDKDQLEVKTPMTAYEPFPEFAVSFDLERGSEGDILPHVNVGPNYQARIPTYISDKQSAKEKYRQEKADLVWDPVVVGSRLLNEEDIASFLQVACSLCVPGSGRNQEYAHHLLFRAKGDLHEALSMLLHPCPKIEKSDPLYSYHYSESDVWSTEDIEAYHKALVNCDKDFLAISKEIRTKSVKECIQFYYLWKKVCPDEYRKLRIIRRKREQDGFHAKGIPPPILEEADEKQETASEVLHFEEAQDPSMDASDSSRSCSPALGRTGQDSDVSSVSGFDSMNPSPAPSSTGSIVNNNNVGECSGFPCKLCGKVFNKIKSRSAHMKIHSSTGKESIA